MGRRQIQWSCLGDSILSNEIRLATSHADFWNGLLPMADAFIRAQNSRPRLFSVPIHAIAPAEYRGIVNEAGFIIFKGNMDIKGQQRTVRPDISGAFEEAIRRIQRLPRSKIPALATILNSGTIEATLIAHHLTRYFSDAHADLIVSPPIPGCGWVNDAEADILSGTTLYEVKAGERHFRIADLRQVLTYCALNFSSKTYRIDAVGLINPRSGAFVVDSLDDICQRVAGAPAVDVLSDIVEFISAPVTTQQAF
jgi:hypothetical protein